MGRGSRQQGAAQAGMSPAAWAPPPVPALPPARGGRGQEGLSPFMLLTLL